MSLKVDIYVSVSLICVCARAFGLEHIYIYNRILYIYIQ